MLCGVSSRPTRPMDRRLLMALAEYPVVASIIGAPMAPSFTKSVAPLAILASVPLGDIEDTVADIVAAGKLVFVNMDSTPGLGHDPGALTYLHRIGASGICSTRGAVLERAGGLGLLTMQKVFVTDRSNLHRSIESVTRSHPDLVQVMPAIVLRYMEEDARGLGIPFLAAGFVRNTTDIVEALRHGAAGISTSDEMLWDVRRADLSPVEPSASERE